VLRPTGQRKKENSMNRNLAVAIVGALALGTASVYAGSACCAAGKAKTTAKAEAKAGCGDIFAKLNLTDEQKAKLAALKAECDKQACSVTGRQKYWKGVKEILTPAQLEACRAECEKAGIKDCPIARTAETRSDTKS
jgi:uncharacterized protein HemX